MAPPPPPVEVHKTIFERTSLPNESKWHNPRLEVPRPEDAAAAQQKPMPKSLDDTAPPLAHRIKNAAEQMQKPRRSEDVKTDSPRDDIQLPTNENESSGEEGLDDAGTQKRAEEALLEFLQNVNTRKTRRQDRFTVPNRMSRMAYNTLSHREAMVPLKERRKGVNFLSWAMSAYTRLMEDRVSALERHGWSGLSVDEEPTDSDSDESEEAESKLKKSGSGEEKAPKTVTSVRRVAWPGFKRKYDRKTDDSKTDASEDHAIDVLMGDAVIPHEVWRDFAQRNPEHLIERARRLKAYEAWLSITLQQGPSKQPQQDQSNSNIHEGPSQSAQSAEITEDFYPPVPDRIRINGEALKQLLQKALDVDFKSSGGPIVLLRPFKLLTFHWDRIWNLYWRLKEKFAEDETQVAVSDDIEGEGGNLLDQYGTKQAYEELQCLIEFMENDLRVFKKIEDAFVKKIAFSELWHIFQPGVEVITGAAYRQIAAYRVLHATGGRPYLSAPDDNDSADSDSSDDEDFINPFKIPEKSSDFVVTCYQIDFDGNKFGPVIRSFIIQKFDGLKDITALPIYPLKFAHDEPNLRETLLRNGALFLDVCVGKHVLYRGRNLHEAEEIDSEIVVDFHAALWDNQDKDKDSWNYRIDFGIQRPTGANKAEVIMVSSGGCRAINCCENDRIFDDLNLDHQLMENFLAERPWLTTDTRYLDDDRSRIPEEDLILMPHRLFAFVLKDRKWAVVDINSVKKVPEPSKETWKSLVLPPGHKNMVYSLVQSHFRDRQRSDGDNETQADLVRGKGKGLIILLHGAPGVGKTSTAECVAELCRRPLYPITCGDLGITAVEVETKLKRIFVQAQKWKCVLLLDEADVFLSERGTDVKHNSLVSVFLRILEYYQGILFLTTNRVGRMDEAFRSRVHISLYYPPLDRESTIKIFKSNLERTAQRKKGIMKIPTENILKFAEDHFDHNEQRVRWNGRQIRNAFHIATALAENDAVEYNEAVEAGGAASDGGRAPRKPKLRAKHFQDVEEVSSKFDEYLTSVLGMTQADRVSQQSGRKDNWRDDRRSREKPARRSRPQRYYDSETDSEDESDVSSRHTKGARRERRERSYSDDSDSQPDPPRRRTSRAVSKSDRSEDEPTTRETKRAAEKRNSRDDERKTHRSRRKNRDREQDRH